MTEENIIHETELNVSGKNYSVQVFSGASGKYYSQTRLGESDVIIIDGISVEDVLERHRFSLPIAIDCRIQWPSLAVISYPTKIS